MSIPAGKLAKELQGSASITRETLLTILFEHFFEETDSVIQRQTGRYKLYREKKHPELHSDRHKNIALGYSIYILQDVPTDTGFYRFAAIHSKTTSASNIVGRGASAHLKKIHRAFLFNPETRDIKLDQTIDLKETLIRIKRFREMEMIKTERGVELTPHGKNIVGTESDLEKELKISITSPLHHASHKENAFPGEETEVSHGKQVQLVRKLGDGELIDIIKKKSVPSLAMRLNILLNAAKQIQKLHQKTPKIVHLDIKPENFRIDSKGNAYLIDFGFSHKEGEREICGTSYYIAPELVLESYSSPKITCSIMNDIYSFGIVMVETISQKPKPCERTKLHPAHKLDGLNTLDVLKNPQHYDLLKLVSKMLNEDPNKRPSIDKVITKLTRKLDKLLPQKPASKRILDFIEEHHISKKDYIIHYKYVGEDKLIDQFEPSQNLLKSWHPELGNLKSALYAAKKNMPDLTYNSIKLEKPSMTTISTKIQLSSTLYKLEQTCTHYIDYLERKNNVVKNKILIDGKKKKISELKDLTKHTPNENIKSLKFKIQKFQEKLNEGNTQEVLNSHRDTGFLHFLKAVAAIFTLGIFSKVRTGSFRFWKTKSSQLIEDSNAIVSDAPTQIKLNNPN